MESHVVDDKGLVSSTPGHTSLADALPTTSSSASTTPVLVPSNLRKEIDPEMKYVKRVTGRHGNTELHFAAQRGDLAAVKQILDDIDFQMVECSSGADFDQEVAEIRTSVVNEVNELGETALFIAADRGHNEVVRELLKHSNHETLTKRNQSMFDPLYISASQGHHETVELLLEFDPTLSKMVGPSNLNPLISAASRGHIAVVNELLSKDSSLLEISKPNGKNVLHLAARQGHMEIVRTLLRMDPRLARRTDRKGQTALHMAVKGVNCEVVELLLSADPATVMLPDKLGNTALHVATRKKQVEMVKTLLSLPDINVNALNQSRKTALDIVEELPLSEESSTIKDCLCRYDAMRANEMNLPSSERRKTATQIKKDKKGVDTPPKLPRTVTQIKRDAHTQLRLLALFWADILVTYAFFVMQNYLTQVWGLSFTHAAGILNVWNGIAMILPVFYAIIRDEMLGNFQMLAISSISYIVGIGFVAMSTPPVLAKYTGMCKEYHPECIGRTQKTLFYIGMALIAEGMAGKAVSLHPFPDEHQGKHEKDLENPSLHPLQLEQQGKNKKNVEIRIGSLRRRGRTIGLILAAVGAMALPYIRPWSLRFGIPAICTAGATFLFWSGWPWYDKGIPGRSPVCNICRAFVAKRIYRGEDKVDKSYTDTPYILRSMEKADIELEHRSPKDQTKNKWTLCSVAEVEEAKIVVQMLPIMLTFIVCGMVSSIGNTYFVEQASHLNRQIGKWSVPLPALLLFQDIFRNSFRILRARGEDVTLRLMHNRFLPVMIGSAMVYSILCCITAAKIEERRLNAIRKHNLMDRPDEDIPMSMYWLIFQFYLLVMFDICFEWGVAAFYNNQVTGTLKNYVMLFSRALLGVGYMLNVLLVYVVGKISERGGNNPNWFQFTSNKSRLDRYFWVLATLSSVNLLIFIPVALCYRNNKKKTMGAGVEEAYKWELGDPTWGSESS